jgi:hypothetical protein
VKEYFHSSFGLYKGGGKKEVTIRFAPQKAKWIRGQIWHKNQKLKELKDGSIELSFEVADFVDIENRPVRFLADGRVIDHVVEAIIECADKAEAHLVFARSQDFRQKVSDLQFSAGLSPGFQITKIGGRESERG